MAKFKIGNYQGIKIDCWTAKDLVGLHHLMKQEGCPNSENLFSDTDKAIELDDVQRRISQKHHADKKSSADMLLHVNDKRLLLADAKFRLSNTRNLDSKEIAKKVSESKAMVVKECGIKYSHLKVILSQLRKRGIIVDGKINRKFIPNIREGDDSFQLLIYFDMS